MTEIDQPSHPAPAAARAAQARHPGRIYVVEDHAFMRRNIVAALERDPGLQVCGEADDISTALPAILSLKPDVVLTDIVLSASNGLDLVRMLHAQRPALPIVATTMFDVAATERRARAAGAVGFVSKLEGPDALLTAIRSALHHSPDTNPSL